MTEPERNENGWRIGEGHPRARLTDAQVCQIRDLHEYRGMRYAEVVVAMREAGVRVSYSYVKRVCLYQRRAQGRSVGRV